MYSVLHITAISDRTGIDLLSAWHGFGITPDEVLDEKNILKKSPNFIHLPVSMLAQITVLLRYAFIRFSVRARPSDSPCSARWPYLCTFARCHTGRPRLLIFCDNGRSHEEMQWLPMGALLRSGLSASPLATSQVLLRS